jgi:ABC-type phosphate/phosphonate transport system permease subunit
MQGFRIVFRAATAIVFAAAFGLGLDLLKSVAGRDVAIGFSAFLVLILVVSVILILATRR